MEKLRGNKQWSDLRRASGGCSPAATRSAHCIGCASDWEWLCAAVPPPTPALAEYRDSRHSVSTAVTWPLSAQTAPGGYTPG